MNNTIFWKCVRRPFRCTYIASIDLDFLVRSAQNCKKCKFLDNLRTITHKGNMETRQMTPFFSSTFSDLTVWNIHFWIWKYSKFIFMWSLLWFILVCKIPQFLAKSYRFRHFITLFWKFDTLRLLKINIMFCPLARAKYPFFLRLQLQLKALVQCLTYFLFFFFISKSYFFVIFINCFPLSSLLVCYLPCMYLL